jgi:hypothetical protein
MQGAAPTRARKRSWSSFRPARHGLVRLWYIAVGDLFWSEPKCLTFQRYWHEGTDRPSAAEILVGLNHVGLDPVCDGVKRI